MKKELIWQGKIARYDLQRKNVKNINMSIRSDGSILVSAPSSVPERVIEEFVASRAELIFQTLERFSAVERNHAAPLTYSDGETVRVLGDCCVLRVRMGARGAVERRGAELILTVKDPTDKALCERTLEKWRMALCRDTVQAICEKVGKTFLKYGFEMPELKFRHMRSRWGSCQAQKRILTFSYALVEAPIECIEYVVWHEFTHFLHPDHSPRFYSTLAFFLPDWRERKQRLEQRATNG